MRRRPSLSCLALAAACLGAAEGGIGLPEFFSLKPVPPEWIEGRTLVVQGDRFRIDTPGEEWSWYWMEKPNTGGWKVVREYECRKRGRIDRILTALVMDPGEDIESPAWKRYLASKQKGIEEEGKWIVDGFDSGPVDAPLPGSYAYRFDLHSTSGLRKSFGGVVVVRRLVYEILWMDIGRPSTLRKAPEEPKEFHPFVASFRLLRRDRSVPIPPGPSAWHFRILGFWCVVSVLWNFLTTAPRMNPGFLAAVHIAVSAWLWTSFEKAAALREGAPPDELARISGLGFQTAILPFALALGALVACRLFRRSPPVAGPVPDDGRDGGNG